MIAEDFQPPSDKGGGFCEAKDGGREKQFHKEMYYYAKSSLLQSCGQLPHQRKPKGVSCLK